MDLYDETMMVDNLLLPLAMVDNLLLLSVLVDNLWLTKSLFAPCCTNLGSCHLKRRP